MNNQFNIKINPVEFCSECNNLLVIRNENGNKYYYCRVCGKKDYICYQTAKVAQMDGRKITFDCASVPSFPYDLWHHQKQADQLWKENNRDGIAEMATATGKTRFALACIHNLIETRFGKNSELRIMVICHSIDILSQWNEQFDDYLPNFKKNLAIPEQSVNKMRITIQMVSFQKILYDYNQNPQKLKEYSCDLIVVDEVHHATAQQFSKIFGIPHHCFLGLSATLEGRMRKIVLHNKKKQIFFQYPLNQAIRDNVVARPTFEIKYSSLNEEETIEYQELTDKITKALANLNLELYPRIFALYKEYIKDVVNDPQKLSTRFNSIYEFVQFMEFLRYNYEGAIPSDLSSIQGMIISRREIINSAESKLDQAFMDIVEHSRTKKCLCFLSSIESCVEFEEQLKEARINAFSIHSNKSKDDNHEALSAFKQANKGCLIAVRKLDEGIDIRDAEIAFNVSYHNTMLQLVQRTGRIIRKYPDKNPLFIHYVVDIDKGSLYLIDRFQKVITESSQPTFLEDLPPEVLEPIPQDNNNQERKERRLQPDANIRIRNNKVQDNYEEKNLSGKTYRCPNCGEKFSDLQALSVHFNREKAHRN